MCKGVIYGIVDFEICIFLFVVVVSDNLKHDIALIKLMRPANVTGPYVNVISLTEDDVPDNTKCIVGGWGQVSSGKYSFIVAVRQTVPRR